MRPLAYNYNKQLLTLIVITSSIFYGIMKLILFSRTQDLSAVIMKKSLHALSFLPHQPAFNLLQIPFKRPIQRFCESISILAPFGNFWCDK